MRLIDAFAPALAYTRAFLDAPEDDFDAFRARVRELLDTGRAHSSVSSTEADVQAAMFAVVAWIDEAVMCSNWSHAGQWQGELLQRAYFTTTRAGVEFFHRMDNIPTQHRELWEVYALCLGMGFHGKFARTQEGAKELAVVRADAMRAAQGDSEIYNEHMFPEAYPERGPDGADKARGLGISAFTWSIILVPLAVVIILYIAFSLVLSSQVSSVMSFIGK